MAENILFCSQCGCQNVASAAFCQRCGANLGPSLSAAPVAYPQAVSSAGYGGFWIRFLAVMIDAILLSIVLLPARIIMFSVVGVHRVPMGPLGHRGVAPVFALMPIMSVVNVGAAWLYEALLTSSSWQGTVGKKVLNLKVTDEAGARISFSRATGRHFAKFLSAMILMIGFIMAAFTDRKRALHDIIAGTLVRKG
jgi:uncharacterized RDD family membrane protein YckC